MSSTPPEPGTDDTPAEPTEPTTPLPTEAADPGANEADAPEAEAQEAPVATVPDAPDAEAPQYEVLDTEGGTIDDADDDEPGFVATPGPGVLGGALAVLGLLLATAVVLLAIGLPALKGKPHELPIGVAGPAQVTSQIKTLFTSGGSNTFSVREYTEESQLRSAITDRTIYGGLVITQEGGATMLVASGASPTVAQTLNSVAAELGGSAGQQIPVSDVVPLPAEDSRGAGLAASGLPLVLAGLAPGMVLVLRRFRGRPAAGLITTLAYSLIAGFGLAAILQYSFGAIAGTFAVNGFGLALGTAAIAVPILGLATIAGRVGVGIGSAVMLLLGYPLSGLSTAREWLPGLWGTLGQALPPGAEATLLRSTAFFEGRGATESLIVLVAWTVGGLVLVVIGVLLNPTDPFDDEPATSPVTAGTTA